MQLLGDPWENSSWVWDSRVPFQSPLYIRSHPFLSMHAYHSSNSLFLPALSKFPSPLDHFHQCANIPVFTSIATKNKTHNKTKKKKKNYLFCYKHISLLYLYSQTSWKHYLYSPYPTSLLRFSLNTLISGFYPHASIPNCFCESDQWPLCCPCPVISCYLAQSITSSSLKLGLLSAPILPWFFFLPHCLSFSISFAVPSCPPNL